MYSESPILQSSVWREWTTHYSYRSQVMLSSKIWCIRRKIGTFMPSWKGFFNYMTYTGIYHVQEFLRREGNKSQAGIPFLYIIVVGVIGILLGYILKRTWYVVWSIICCYSMFTMIQNIWVDKGVSNRRKFVFALISYHVIDSRKHGGTGFMGSVISCARLEERSWCD